MKFRMKKLRGIMVAAIFFPCLSTGVTSDQRMNSLISILESGRPAIGIRTGALTSPRIVKTLATSDVDFIVVDIEHEIYDFGMLHRFLLEVQDFSNRYRTEPRVAPAVLVKLAHRATWDPRYEITESLKVGPSMGIWIPTVEGRADLERAISAVRGAETSALEGLDIPLERSDAWPLNPRGELLVVAIIETEEGVRHAQEIVETPGLSALGTAHIPDADAERILKMCQRRGVVPAVNATPEDVKAKIDSGYKLIIMGLGL
jgi:4-hydroxy-2-oxoheptanedioate aldolase